MFKQHYQMLFAFGWHTTANLLAKAEKLDEATLNAPSIYGHGSMYDLFVHLWAALENWRATLENGKTPPLGDTTSLTSVPALRQALAQEFDAWHTLIEGLSEEQIARMVTLENAKGETYEVEYWRVFQQLVFHNMQHATELAQLLTAAGQSPGDIDFFYFRG